MIDDWGAAEMQPPALLECLGASLWDEEGAKGALLSAAPQGGWGVTCGECAALQGVVGFFGEFPLGLVLFLLQTELSLE